MFDEIISLCRIALVHSAEDNKEFYACATILALGALALQLARHNLQKQYVKESPTAKK